MRAADAHTWLEHLFADTPGMIEVRAIAPDGPARATFHNSIDSALATIESEARRDRNVYAGVATRRDSTSGGKDNLRAVRAMWCDVDFHAEADRNAFDAKLAAFPVHPSMLVSSGGGVHLFWRLREPFGVTCEPAQQALEYALKGLADVLAGDRAATDASRILRVPGTVNLPDARKRARGRVSAMASICETTPHVYQVDDFEEFAERGRRLQAERSQRRTYRPAGWDGCEPAWLEMILGTDSDLRRRFERDAAGLRDSSNSGIDLSLASRAAILTDLEAADLEAVVRCSRARAGLSPNGPSYYSHTIGKALGARERFGGGL